MPFEFEKIDPDENDQTRILYEHFTSDIRKSYSRVKVGDVTYCMPSKYQKIAENLENFEVRDDDIWVISFPKSGTTWTQEMVWIVANDFDFEGAKTNLVERYSFIEFSLILEIENIKDKFPSAEFPPSAKDSVTFASNKTSPRFFKSHLPWDLLPKQIKEGKTKAKIIYVARNPKDIIVSYSHQQMSFMKFTGNLNHFCEVFLADLGSFVPYWIHIKDFWNRRHQSNILYITYESMKNDLGEVIKKTAHFLDKSVTDDNLEKLKSHLNFDSMKNNPAVNSEDVMTLWSSLDNSLVNDCSFIRRGVVGGYKDEMTPEYVKKIDEWFVSNLEKYHLPLESV